MRGVATVVLLLQLTSLVGAAGLCVCDSRRASTAENCCLRPARPGTDCCTPDRLTRTQRPTHEADASVIETEPVRSFPVLESLAVPLPLSIAPTRGTVPRLILRI